MLFMGIFTWEPDKNDDVMEAYKKIAAKGIPEGIKGTEWMDLGGNRVFGLVEVSDPKGASRNNYINYHLLKLDAM